jgi:protein-S-isoprenylcysteine O-methyltransferase Ste14
MRFLELKIPPPVLAVAIGGLMWLVSRSSPRFAILFPSRIGFFIGLAAAGILSAVLGAVTFRRAGTTLNPTKPQATSSLVTSGVYTFTRNPMYLGLLLLLTGWAIFLSNALACALLPVFVIYMNFFQIRPEERALTSLFGKEFAQYKMQARRWL